MDISALHERKIEKSWLPSSILICYAFQHNFLGLFIPANKGASINHVTQKSRSTLPPRDAFVTLPLLFLTYKSKYVLAYINL